MIATINLKDLIKYLVGLIIVIVGAIYSTRFFVNKNENMQFSIVDMNAKNLIKSNINIANYSLYDLYPTTDDLINTIENISNYDNYIFNAFTLNATYARLSQAERIKNEQNNK